MAFSIREVEKVKFGKIEVTPKVNAELLLRLGDLSFKTSENIREAEEVISSAFPDDKDGVLNYLRSGLVPIFELMRLHAYLQGGEQAVAAYDRSFSHGVDKAIEKAMNDDV